MESEAKRTELQPFAKKVKDIRALLERTKPQMQMALPKHVSIDRMLRTTMTAIQRNPKLLECTQVSLLAAIMQGAQLGLETDGVLGEAYLVPYKKTVQFIPGYKGLMKLARNSREISTIFASEVYRSDQFQFQYGSDSKLHHVPVPRLDEKDPIPIIAFYACAKLKDGNSQFVVLWKYQVDAIRDKSAGYIAAQKFDMQSPWDSHYEEMGKKTAIRRLCKYLPATAELQKAIALDEMAEAGLEQGLDSIIDITEMTEEPKSKLDDLVDKKTKRPAAGSEEKTLFQSEPPGNPNYGEYEREPGVEG